MMIVRTPAELGAAIRDRRRRFGLKQRVLAQKVGVSRQWVIEVERGKPGAEVGLVLRTLAALGIVVRVRDEQPLAEGASRPVVDVDAIVARARKRRDE
jgi:HTH-type transcriptional regulator / antitoxin HipB